MAGDGVCHEAAHPVDLEGKLMTRIPLAVLDLAPRSEGATIAEGVRNAIDLAGQAERFGYERAAELLRRWDQAAASGAAGMAT
jgi:hypothetical protein